MAIVIFALCVFFLNLLIITVIIIIIMMIVHDSRHVFIIFFPKIGWRFMSHWYSKFGFAAPFVFWPIVTPYSVVIEIVPQVIRRFPFLFAGLLFRVRIYVVVFEARGEDCNGVLYSVGTKWCL